MSLLEQFSVNLLRQKTLGTVARYISGFLSQKEPGELGVLAANKADIVDEIEGDLRQRLPQYTLEQMAKLAVPYAQLLKEEDFEIIFQKVSRDLPPKHVEVLQEHYAWYCDQMYRAWSRFKKLITER